MKSLLLVVLLGLVSACSSLRPVVDQTRYFVLTPVRQQQSLAKPETIGISHIELPDYLRKREMAWRSSDQEIRYASNFQWAEAPDKMIGRILAANLGAGTLVAPNFRRGEVQAEISVAFAHFESDETGKVNIEAAWTIRYSSGNLARGAAKFSTQGPLLLKEPAGTAAELSSGLAQLGAEIAASIRITP